MVAPVDNFNLEHSLDVDHINSSDEELLQTTQEFEAGNVQSTEEESRVEQSIPHSPIKCSTTGGKEHHSLKIGEKSNFSIILRNGVKHLIYSEGLSKTNNSGFLHRDLTPKTVEIGPNQEKPTRCLVRLYEKPKTCNAYYVRPLKYPKRDTWYCAVLVGRHTLFGVVKRLCANAGFNGFYTNHSLRATTRLYDSGIDEQLIAERTGHRSTIRGYKRTSTELLKVVDDVVQGKKTRKSAPTKKNCKWIKLNPLN
ncbi:hypothetical protein LOTGIDRAFT_158358 [Lottia gigantea]|uniref:DUF3504 domain-containing protein n=1 Tax=Lottia gigantea TaxID=225164 RepID=V4AZV2_LOTGI|nr:hypothetical protein LOTGIDRAFT_158358 [Lottia gigantea]ESO99281.1 hypothetical protein LOTGIDRAFT_158358 [Lottia gigantea]